MSLSYSCGGQPTGAPIMCCNCPSLCSLSTHNSTTENRRKLTSSSRQCSLHILFLHVLPRCAREQKLHPSRWISFLSPPIPAEFHSYPHSSPHNIIPIPAVNSFHPCSCSYCYQSKFNKFTYNCEQSMQETTKLLHHYSQNTVVWHSNNSCTAKFYSWFRFSVGLCN